MSEKTPELRKSGERDELGRIKKGHTINPGGVSREKRAFLKRLEEADADEIYEAFMDGVRQREWSVVIRAVEYIAGKPRSSPEDLEATKAGFSLLQLTREEMLKVAREEKP